MDASEEGLGVVLIQIENEERKPLAFFSRNYQMYEESYHVTHKECLGILYGIRQCRPWVFGRKSTVVTDHCGLCYLMKAKDLSQRLARWSLELAEYNFEIIYKSGKKHNDADYLSRNFRCQRLHPQTDGTELESRINILRKDLEEISSNILEHLSIDSMKNHQINDPNLGSIIRKLLKETSASEEEITRLESQYVIENGLLYRLISTPVGQVRRIYVPETMVRDLLYVVHDLMSSGHFGIIKTIWKLRQYVYWPNLIKDTNGYVRSCHECQVRKPPNHRPFGPQMITTPIPSEAMTAIAIDIVGPLTKSHQGNRFILTVTDQLTKFAIAVLIKDTSSRNIMQTLENFVFYSFGAPKTLLTDNGRNLTSAEIEQFFEKWGITHVTTTPYHPMSNGMVEKFNGTLAVLLTTNIKGDIKLWDEHIPISVYAYNSAIHQSTGFTPFYLLFGKHEDPTFLVKIGCQPQRRPHEDLKVDREIAAERIHRSQIQNQEAANKSRSPSNIQVGDLVLLFVKPRKRQASQKLQPSYSGPHRVTKVVAPNVLEIQSVADQKCRVENLSNLKKYHCRTQFRLASEQTTRQRVTQGSPVHESPVSNSNS